MKKNEPQESDICLILEGSYPYVTGGVSTWTQDLIKTQSDKSFSVVSLLPPNHKEKPRYELPLNVALHQNIYLQDLPEIRSSLTQTERKKLFEAIEIPLLNIQHKPNLSGFKKIIDEFKRYEGRLGRQVLFNSEEAWQMLVRMYLSTIGESSFINYFWSHRCLLGGIYSILLSPLPKAKVYHAISTGFAGLLLARARIETGRPCLLTEHGIYTNERRIEIASADWLSNNKAMDLNLEISLSDRDLKDFWIDMFAGYSQLSYQACQNVITLFEGNKQFQLEDGADRSKLKVIPNGIDFDRFNSIKKSTEHPPTVAFIGRVVPIKDVKNFIRAIHLIRGKISNLRCLIMGPQDEDPDYTEECKALVVRLHLENIITFTGKVNVDEYMGSIDVVVLPSISEAQPLVVLEAGAAGIPSVSTDVGALSDLIYGRSDESPNLGQGGVLCPLADPVAVADGIYKLFSDPDFYDECSKNIQERIKTYYQEKDQKDAYSHLYEKLMEEASSFSFAEGGV